MLRSTAKRAFDPASVSASLSCQNASSSSFDCPKKLCSVSSCSCSSARQADTLSEAAPPRAGEVEFDLATPSLRASPETEFGIMPSPTEPARLAALDCSAPMFDPTCAAAALICDCAC